MSLTESHLAEWESKMIHAQIRDLNSKKDQPRPPPPPPPPELSETDNPKRSIRDFFLKKSYPWGHDKLGKTNLFHLFNVANTEYLYTKEGHEVKFNADLYFFRFKIHVNSFEHVFICRIGRHYTFSVVNFN